MKVVVTIPTYNERENITTLLGDLSKAFSGMKKHTILYLVIDDNSPDGTGAVVRTYQKTHANVFLIEGQKEGLGRAILRGMKYAFDTLHAEVVIQIDADLSHDPAVAPKLLSAIDNGATFALGSRYISGGGIPQNWGLIRKIYSVMGNNIVRFGLGHSHVHDWTGGFRAYTRKFYDALHRQMTPYSGYVFQIAFLHKALHEGAIVQEIPFHFTDRKYGHSKIAPAEYIYNIYKYIFLARFDEVLHGRFGKFLVVGGFGFTLNALILVVLHEYGHFPAAAANLIGAAVAIFSNYNFNNLWTFKHTKIFGVRKYMKNLLFFYGTSVFGVLVIQTGVIWLGVHLINPDYYFIYFLMGTSILMLWNYTMYSRVIWKKHS